MSDRRRHSGEESRESRDVERPCRYEEVMELLSPELALVDSELADRARSALPDPDDCLAPRNSASRKPVSSVDRRGIRPSLPATLALLLVALVAGSPVIDLIPRGTAGPSFVESELSVAAVDTATVRAASARSRTRHPRAIELKWPVLASADFYNVVIWRDGVRLFDLWPVKNAVSIPGNGVLESHTLVPGRYEWSVFPVFRRGQGTEYGSSLAEGEIVIAR